MKPFASIHAFCAFNSNIDYVTHLNARVYSRLGANQPLIKKVPGEASTIKQVKQCVDWSLRTGEAVHVGVAQRAFNSLKRRLGKPDEELLGGQAGIMANNLVELGANVTAYPVTLSKKQAKLFDERVYGLREERGRLVARSIQRVAKGNKAKVNWIVEFAEGFHGAPRANRVILSSHLAREILFPRSWPLKELSFFGETIDVAFIAGLQSLKTGYGAHSFRDTLNALCRQLAALRKKNKGLLLHVEYVPFKNKALELPVLKKVFRYANSLGVNEHELQQLSEQLGYGFADPSQPANAARAALNAFDSLEITRLHVHSLGYHVFVLGKEHDPKRAFEGGQFASLVASEKAGGGKSPKTPKAAFDAVKQVVSPFPVKQRASILKDGYVKIKGNWLVVTPTTFVAKPKRTVGLGDVVSSTALAFERATL